MPLSHRHVEVFRALMNTGSVTGAAQALFTSQPTISRELARLEQRLGIALFDRVRGRLQPTAQALALFDEVQRSYVGLERIAGVAAQLKQFSSGQISALCLPVFSHSLLPGAIARFAQQHPAASIAVTPQESPFLEEWLASQSHDLGLTEHERAPPGTRQRLLMQADEVCVLPEGHVLLAKPRLELSDFAGQPLVAFPPSDPYRQLLDALFAQHGVVPRQRVQTHSAASVCAMVRHGLGLAVVNPLTALEFAGQGLAMRPLAHSIPFRVSLVRPERRPGSVLVDQFEQALQDEAAALLQRLEAGPA
jgi:DNA-binding transcriptional LysR family regulator